MQARTPTEAFQVVAALAVLRRTPGFSCEGRTAAASTEPCAMLAMQGSAGHCVILRAVQRWALCSAARCVALRAAV